MSVAAAIIGILLVGPVRDSYWRIEIADCGTVVTYPLNKLPEVDVPCPCGNPTHWIIKYEEKAPWAFNYEEPTP